MKFGIWVIIWLGLAGCNRDWQVDGEKVEGETAEEVGVRLNSGSFVDSAQVFFFRSVGDQDTLLLREVIHDIEQYRPRTFLFRLPPGRYRVCICGNVPTTRIVVPSPSVLDSIWLDYRGGREASAIYFGQSRLNVGVDTVVFAGMLLLSASVELTVDPLPSGIEKMTVRLTNTAAGMYLNGSYLTVATDPPLTKTWTGIEKDSSYTAQFYCFPAPGFGKSRLEVECYDAMGNVVYSGQSAPFEARPGENRTMFCHFAAPSGRMRGKTRFTAGSFYLKKAER